MNRATSYSLSPWGERGSDLLSTTQRQYAVM